MHERLQDYLAGAGYTIPHDLLPRLAEAGLRSRGPNGRGEPVAARWAEVAGARSQVRCVVANGAETSPGSKKDQHLMTHHPHRVLHGALAAARAVGAQTVYLYIKSTAEAALAAMEAALAELEQSGAVPDLPAFELFRAPDTAVAGEETAVCDAIEGFEGRPQVKPPYPAQSGILGKPTLVVNVETLAAAAAVLRGDAAAAAEVYFTLSGDVNRPGVYAAPLGTPIRELIETYGGGATGPIVAVLPGGYRSGPLTPDELDLPFDYDPLLAAGTTLGSAHLVVLTGPGRLADLMTGALDLMALGSCRQCEICAQGTARLFDLAARISAGEEEAPLREQLADWALILHGKGNCQYPSGAAMLTRRAVERFPSWCEEASVRGGHR